MPPQLSRLFIIFGFIVAIFIAVRYFAKPDSFYQYGHYRGKALTEIAGKETKYAPRGACADCHDAEFAANKAGPHSVISCQTCHGPAVEHVNDPSTSNITKPTVLKTCVRCHEANKARPKRFPQVQIPDHNDGKTCNKCHNVHNPLDIKI